MLSNIVRRSLSARGAAIAAAAVRGAQRAAAVSAQRVHTNRFSVPFPRSPALSHCR